MWLTLQQDKPDDYVMATGESMSVRTFVELAFAEVGRTIEWQGSGVNETGLDGATGKVVVEVDPTYFRPTEVHKLIGDSTKARNKLGWRHKISCRDMIKEMMASDLVVMKKERAFRSGDR